MKENLNNNKTNNNKTNNKNKNFHIMILCLTLIMIYRFNKIKKMMIIIIYNIVVFNKN